MNMKLKEKFLLSWEKYFASAELPMVFYYADEPGDAEMVKPAAEWTCFVAELNRVRNGKSLCFGVESIGCFGGKRYCGFSFDLMPGFEYFLSTGIPGKMEGERYKKSPELVKQIMENQASMKAPGKYIIFKRWDALTEADEPLVVVFFARPDVLSGLFTLAGFDQAEPAAVYAPFSAGCGSIVQYPYLEAAKETPKCILGMFDVSARPCVPADMLSFSAPMKKFETMVGNMDESFLITPSWDKVRKRIAKAEK
jgi:hypothetical protein